MEIMRLAVGRGQSQLHLKPETVDLKYHINPIGKGIYDKNPIRDMYTWIPWCQNADDEDSFHYFKVHCMKFQPVVTEKGICHAYNVRSSMEMLEKNSRFSAVFQKAFGSDLFSENLILNGSGSGKEHELRFFVHTNNIMRRPAVPIDSVYVSLTSASEYFMLNTKKEVKMGFATSFRVQPMEIRPTGFDLHDFIQYL